ncbi:MAG: hypothetical protein K2G88_07450 [Oscillospiraceae bacterium]|nr:hypothetical protein [Oscillospiraceae bacterium]
MADFLELEQEFWQLDTGTPRLNAMRKAIAEADLKQDLNWQFNFRYDYIEESIFCGDRYFALIVFPELLNLYENNQELHEDLTKSHNVLVCFRWIVEAVGEFPNISKQEVDSYFRLFKKMLLEQGKSLSIYYMKRSLFYMHVDKNIATADFYRFLKAPLDDISDGKALYYDQQAMYYLYINKEEKALKSAKLIFEGKLKASSLPQSTYHDFMRFYLERENYEQALHYAKLIISNSEVNGNEYYLHVIGSLMSLYSILDIQKGLKLFARNYNLYFQSRNPWLKMYFAIGAYHLFDKIANHKINFKSPENTPISSMSVQEIAEYFYQSANDLVNKFDSRNGTDDFAKMLYLFDKRS